MTYQLISGSDSVLRTDDEGIISLVPADPANRDWQSYQAWLADENEPDPAA